MLHDLGVPRDLKLPLAVPWCLKRRPGCDHLQETTSCSVDNKPLRSEHHIFQSANCVYLSTSCPASSIFGPNATWSSSWALPNMPQQGWSYK